MRVTIIKDDNAVVVNGEKHAVDCSDLPADFHALQWNDLSGEIEFRITRCTHCSARSKKGNEIISDFAPYAPYVSAWRTAKAVADAKGANENVAGPQG